MKILIEFFFPLVAVIVGFFFAGRLYENDMLSTRIASLENEITTYAVADSLRECFTVKCPDCSYVDCGDSSILPEHCRNKKWMISATGLIDSKWFHRKPKDTLLDSLIDTTIFVIARFPSARYKGFRNVRLTNDLMTYKQWTKTHDFLYTDSGLNWSALPFLMLEDSNHIFITSGDNIGDTLRVLEWVQRPWRDTVDVKGIYYLNKRDSVEVVLGCQYGYRWVARVEGM